VNRRCNNNQHWSRYDWNVEENYFGLSRANRGNLLGSLSHGLLSTLPAMEDNAIQLINATVGSGAMLIAQGYGENMIASTLANGSLLNASAVAASDAAGTHQPGIMRGVAFSAHVIWRACHADLNISCINEEVLPLLRGAISTYVRSLYLHGGGETGRGAGAGGRRPQERRCGYDPPARRRLGLLNRTKRRAAGKSHSTH
jgi:hypothetical protein